MVTVQPRLSNTQQRRGVLKHQVGYFSARLWHLRAFVPDSVTRGAQTQTAKRKMELNVEYLLDSAATEPRH